ncbi:alpha-1,2-fucosyltransferase [Sphingobacterium faecium]|uniref:alpha-1,2-fucosyltransferase n=1 Tax=Sphingobacterium faecium TaxID=34087 RepID=UPI00320A4E84
MKIVKFLGGLGNQMFQYAFYLNLLEHFKTVKADLKDFKSYSLHNGFELEGIFPIKLEKASSFDLKLYLPYNRKWIWRKLRYFSGTKKAYFEENPFFSFQPNLFLDDNKRYYWGYWQNIDYITPVASQLRKDFQFLKINDVKNKELLEVLKNQVTVSVHIRRGDYLNEPSFVGICDLFYYQKAIQFMQENLQNPLFMFFSNDINWCKDHFDNLNAKFIDWNTGKESFRDMQCMSLCQHNIIANSSFSWWAAWLNQNPNKIIVSPSKWINDTSLKNDGLILPEFVTF